MNLSELKKLKDGDVVIFNKPFPSFTLDNKYVVRETMIGRIVYDDSGMGRFINGIEHHFKKGVAHE